MKEKFEDATINKILPNLGFHEGVRDMLQHTGLLAMFPNLPAMSMWFGGFINNSLGKLGLLAFLFKIKSPFQGGNIAPPVGLPNVPGITQGGKGQG